MALERFYIAVEHQGIPIEVYFDDMEHLQRAMGSPEGKATAADLANFATGGVTMMISEVA